VHCVLDFCFGFSLRNGNKDIFEKGFDFFWFDGKTKQLKTQTILPKRIRKEKKIKENKNPQIFDFAPLIGIAARNVVFIINNALRLLQEALQTCERILQ
jgi:hypothetical protein